MTVFRRCGECGSWGEECASETPQADCACARCANARVKELEAELASPGCLRGCSAKRQVDVYKTALRELYEAALKGVMETNMKHGGRFDEAMEKAHSLLGGAK